MVLTFYWHPASGPAKVVWSVLEALAIPYEKRFIDLIGKKDHKSPEYLAINPEGKVPYIVDGNFNLGESRAIICYLCSKYEENDKEKKLYPTELKARSKVNESLFHDFQYFTNILEYSNILGVLYRGETGPIPERWPALEDNYNRLERRLTHQEYMASDYITVADYSAFAVVAGIEIILPELDFDKYPRLLEWKKKMEDIPAVDFCYGDSVAKFKEKFDEIVAANKEKNTNKN
uniref:glutathione S-transferase 1-like n=1 Tax=Styela clava TaxID=7725 RepID=UPI001939D4ED|nr:glutathione S-transferase 1-like [Styela clava]